MEYTNIQREFWSGCLVIKTKRKRWHMQKDHRNHEALRQGVFLLKHNRQTDGQNNVKWMHIWCHRNLHCKFRYLSLIAVKKIAFPPIALFYLYDRRTYKVNCKVSSKQQKIGLFIYLSRQKYKRLRGESNDLLWIFFIPWPSYSS